MSRKPRSIVAQVDSEIEIRTETLLGREYTVVPVVAMVEGVRFGAAQTVAELGLATEFGDTPIMWANRPLVLNHPKVEDSFVSANSPEILESYFLGLTMNPLVDGTKLKLEAWFDNERIEELGGEAEELLDAIKNGEVIEVSVGFFSNVEQVSGKFNGQSYGGIWRNIKPDHLAILSKGTTGACSVESGCGIPRINQQGDINVPDPEMKPNCSCQHDEPVVVETGKKKGSVPQVKPFEQVEAEARTSIRQANTAIVAQMIGDDMLDSDVRKIINNGLQKKYNSYTYLYGFTSEYAIFERYNYDPYYGYRTYKIGINVTDGKVEFVGEPEEVILQTKVVPVTQSRTTPPSEVTTQENDMPQEDKTKTTQEVPTTPTTPTTTTQTATPVATPTAPVVQVAQPAPVVQETPKELTIQEYINQAPAGMREFLDAGVKALTNQKAALVKACTDNPNNKFTKEWLEAQSIEVLETLNTSMGGASYSGRAAPVAPVTQEAATMPVQKAFTPKVVENKTAA